MTGVLLQVRLGSTRLPNKALMPLADRTVIAHAMASLRRLPAARHLLVTDEASAGALEPHARAGGFGLFAGPEHDVLERYVLAARATGVDEIVRATGDNPLVSWELARMAVAVRRRFAADYAAFDGLPLGTGVEVVRTEALEQALRESDDAYDHEHVSPYLYRNPDRFVCRRVSAPPAYVLAEQDVAAEHRVTVDTADDYRWVERVFRALYDGGPVPLIRLVRWLGSARARREYEDVHAPGA